MSPSSCFNILKTLTHENLLTFDPKTKKYALEALPAQYFSVAPRMHEWFDWLRDRLVDLAGEFLLSCGLWQVRGDRLVLIDVIDSPDATRVHLATGQRTPLYLGAMGRCVAAVEGHSRESIPKLIAHSRWQNGPSPQAYWDSIEHVRHHGWAIDRNNFIRGLTTVAAPVRASERTARHCLTATGFSGQHEDRVLGIIGEKVAAIAGEAETRWHRLAAG
jgi:DNA-binding IclR family transcriptional regulator